MANQPIGIFDSGLGGLTVARAIAQALPDESLVYLGDTARCPYGPQPLDDVRRYVFEIGSWLQAQDVKLIVIACNTATAAGLSLAQQSFAVPVIGVVEPGARAAAMGTRNRKVGVIATIGTVETGAYANAVHQFDAGVTVYSCATPRYVDIVEEGLRRGNGPVEDLLADTTEVFIRPSFYEISRDYLDPLKRIGVDTLVLGCTHFPLLQTAIAQAMGTGVRIISSAEETAREVGEALGRRDQLADGSGARVLRFATTGDPSEFERLGSRVWREPIGPVERVELTQLATFADDEHARLGSPGPEPSCA